MDIHCHGIPMDKGTIAIAVIALITGLFLDFLQSWNPSRNFLNSLDPDHYDG